MEYQTNGRKDSSLNVALESYQAHALGGDEMHRRACPWLSPQPGRGPRASRGHSASKWGIPRIKNIGEAVWVAGCLEPLQNITEYGRRDAWSLCQILV